MQRRDLTQQANASIIYVSNEPLPFCSHTHTPPDATRDTFGITLSYTMFALSRNPSLQDRLHTELTASIPPPILSAILESSSSNFSSLALSQKLPSTLESFELLNAVIKEGLRLRNIPPLAQPRYVPDGKSVTLCGYEVPEGTKVSTYATSTHLMPTIFDSPDEFQPDRWLQKNRAKVRNMENNFWPLGMGSRVCLGQHLAMESELRALPMNPTHLLPCLLITCSASIRPCGGVHALFDDCHRRQRFRKWGWVHQWGPSDHLFLKFQARENNVLDKTTDTV